MFLQYLKLLFFVYFPRLLFQFNSKSLNAERSMRNFADSAGNC